MWRWISATLLAALFIMPVAAQAQTAAPTRLPQTVVLVVDYDRLTSESRAGKDLERQVSSIRTRFENDAKGHETRLRQEEEKLRKQQPTLAADAFEKQRAAFSTKVMDAQRSLQTRAKQLEDALASAKQKLDQALVPILREIMTKRAASTMLFREQVMYVDPSLDVTQETLAQLDRSLPSVKLDVASK